MYRSIPRVQFVVSVFVLPSMLFWFYWKSVPETLRSGRASATNVKINYGVNRVSGSSALVRATQGLPKPRAPGSTGTRAAHSRTTIHVTSTPTTRIRNSSLRVATPAKTDVVIDVPAEHIDPYSANHEIKLLRMQADIAVDPMDALLSKQAAAQSRYIESDKGFLERTDQAMVVLCTKEVTCYGLGDRFFGLMTNYLSAVIAGKPFFVQHNKPADLNEHLVSNAIDWHISSVKHRAVRQRLLNISDCKAPECTQHVIELPYINGKHVINGALIKAPLVYCWGNARTNVFHDGMELAKIFPTLKPGVAAWSAEQKRFWAAHTSSRLWRRLFRFSDKLRKSADDILSAAFKPLGAYDFRSLMLCTPCVHVRTGHGLHEPTRHGNEHDFKTCMNTVSTGIKKSHDARCSRYRNNATDNWIVLSDSNMLVDSLREGHGSAGIVFGTSGSGPIVHAETIKLGSQRAVDGLRRAMIDFYILSHCRYHIASLSTFDGTASIAHGAEVRRWDMETNSPCSAQPSNIGVWQRDVHAH